MPPEILTPDEILGLLVGNPARTAEITAGMSDAQLKTAPAAGEWSAVEVLGHLRACGDMWGGAIRRIVADKLALSSQPHPTFRAVNPRTWIKQTDYLTLEFSESFAAYREQRAELVELLRGLPAEGWERSGTVMALGGGWSGRCCFMGIGW